MVRRRIAVGETGAVVDVGGSIRFPGQRELPANVQGIALIVIEVAAPGAKGKVGEPAVDIAAAESELIGIGEVKLRAFAKIGGAQRQFPAADARALNGDGEE